MRSSLQLRCVVRRSTCSMVACGKTRRVMSYCRQGALFGLFWPHQCSADNGADTRKKQALYHMPGWPTLLCTTCQGGNHCFVPHAWYKAVTLGERYPKEETCRALLKKREHRPGARNDAGVNGFKSVWKRSGEAHNRDWNYLWVETKFFVLGFMTNKNCS